MKLKELFYVLGLRPKPRVYGHRLQVIQLPSGGTVDYARWLHPKAHDLDVSAQELDQLRGFLRPGDLAIDIGAHTGDTTLPIALACGAEGVVLAFEPNPYVFEVLRVNASLNAGKTHIVPLCCAVTPQEGTFEFRYSDPGYVNGGDYSGRSVWRHGGAFALKVHGRRLQDVLAEQNGSGRRVRYIKVDAEGQDLAILRSITDILAAHRPYIRAEVYRHLPANVRLELHRFLSGLHYKLIRADENALFAGERLSEDDMMRWPHFDIFAIPDTGTAN